LQAVKDPRDPYNFLGVLGGVEEKMLGDSRLGQGSGQGLFLLIVFWGCRRRGDRETERCSDAVSLFHSLFEIVLCFCVFFFTDALDAVMLRAKREKLDSSTNAQKYSLYSNFSIVNIPGH
jgi:Na+/phosphate symporter